MFSLPFCGIMEWVMKMDELKNRKTTRLKGADYNRNQAVFLTICTKERKCILSRIVGTGEDAGHRRTVEDAGHRRTVEDAGPYSTEFRSVTFRVHFQKILQQRLWNKYMAISLQ